MSQWGASAELAEANGKATFVPHIAGRPFAEAQPSDLIDDVVLTGISNGCNVAALAAEASKFIGQPYHAWLDRFILPSKGALR